MQKTTNYGFPKPEDDDFFNVKDFADMMDKVDETLAKVENAGGIYVGGTNLSTEATINDEEAEYPVLSKNARQKLETALRRRSQRSIKKYLKQTQHWRTQSQTERLSKHSWKQPFPQRTQARKT